MATEYQKRTKKKRGTLPKEVAKERQSERLRRHAEAQRRANLVMKDRYPEEWAALYKQERAGVDAERGPLPGDQEDDTPREG